MSVQHPSNAGENLNELFKYHPPTGDQPERYERIRQAGKALALEIITCCQGCADRSAAIRKVREAVMTANAAIALEPNPSDQAVSAP